MEKHLPSTTSLLTFFEKKYVKFDSEFSFELKWRGAKPQTPSAKKKLSSPPRQDAELITETEVVKNNESISKTLSLSDQKVSKPGMYKIELFQKGQMKRIFLR